MAEIEPRPRQTPGGYIIHWTSQSIFEQSAQSAEDHYRFIYFEAIDLAVSSMQTPFDQKGYQMLQKIESVLLDSNPQQLEENNDLSDIIKFYGNDIKKHRLIAQLTNLHQNKEHTFEHVSSVIDYLKSISETERAYFSEVVKLVKLILVAAATNAVSERSFSALRRLKNWLRATMAQDRLNWCMLLLILCEKTDSDIVKSCK